LGALKLFPGTQRLIAGSGKLIVGSPELIRGTRRLILGAQNLFPGTRRLIAGSGKLIVGGPELIGGTPCSEWKMFMSASLGKLSFPTAARTGRRSGCDVDSKPMLTPNRFVTFASSSR
jgi:hypothetical protein